MPPEESLDGDSSWGRVRTALLLAVIPLALLGPILLSGQLFLPSLPVGLAPLAQEHPEAAAGAFENANFPQADRVFPSLTDQIAIREEVLGGAVPSWEPHLAMGVPLAAGSMVGAWYPPNWLGLLLPPEHAAAPLAMLSLFLAGLGLFLFLRRIGLGQGAALVGAVALQTGGWGVGNLYYFMKVDAALWLPWSLWAVEGLARRKPWSGAVLALSFTLALLGGFVPIALFAITATGIYAVARLTPLARVLPFELGEEADAEEGAASAPLPSWILAGIFAGLGLLGACAMLLPMAEASRQSLRIDHTEAELAGETLPVGTIFGTVVPDLVGSPTESTPPGRLPAAWWLAGKDEAAQAEVANQLEWNTYAGAVVALLAIVGLIVHPRRAALPVVLLICVFGYAQGWAVLRWTYHLPGLNIGAPNRVLSVAWVLWPWLAALGVDGLATRRRGALGSFLVASFMLACIAFLSWSSFEPVRWAQHLEELLLERWGDAVGLEGIRQRVTPQAATLAGERLEGSLAQVFAAGLSSVAAGMLLLVFHRERKSFSKGTPAWLYLAALGFVFALALAPVAGRALGTELGTPPALVALFAVGLFVFLAWDRVRPSGVAAWLPLVLVVGAEGLFAAAPHVIGRDAGPGGVFPPSAAIDAVRAAAGEGRVLRYDPTPSGVAHVEGLARPNMLEAYRVSDLTAYTIFTPRTLTELYAKLDPRSRYRSGFSRLSEPGMFTHPLLDLTNVTVVLAREPLEVEGLEPVYATPGFHAYRRTTALGPARVVPQAAVAASDDACVDTLLGAVLDPRVQTLLAPGSDPQNPYLGSAANHAPGEVRVSRPARNRFHVELEQTSGGWLVMHEQFYPGWKASVNGQRVEIVRADHALRAVRVPAGDVVVETWYAPSSARFGLFFSVLAVAAALWISRRWRV